MTGAPLATRIDRDVNFDFSSAAAPPGITKLFVRWTGWLTPTESGTYRLGVHGIMNRLYLDDKLVVEDLKLHGPSPKTADVQLEKGHRYAVRLESLGGRGLATKLIWMREIPDALERAVTAAQQADVVVAVVGITSDLEGEEMDVEVPGFQGGDRTSLDLPEDEEKLLQAVADRGQTAGGGADERERAGGELGRAERQCDSRCLVLRRRRRSGRLPRPSPAPIIPRAACRSRSIRAWTNSRTSPTTR